MNEREHEGTREERSERSERSERNKLFTLEFLLRILIEKVTRMSTELDRLTQSVARITEQDDSIITLVQGLAQQIRDNANNPAALNALADSLDADSQKVADAVTANTIPPPAVG